MGENENVRGQVIVAKEAEALGVAREWKDKANTIWTGGSRIGGGGGGGDGMVAERASVNLDHKHSLGWP